MIRIRRSFLEDYRRVVASDFGDEAALIRAVKGNPDPPNWMMECGTGFHRALAGEPPDEYGPDKANELRFGQAWFRDEDIDAGKAHVGRGLHEVLARKRIEIAGHVVEVEGTADWVLGLVLQDHKCKWTTPDARDYEGSLQWRVYLWLHDAAMLRYNLFSFKDPDPEGLVKLKEIVSFKFWRYDGMEAEIAEWVRRFVEWADERSLLPYLAALKKTKGNP
jgi:hypothetical protein